MISIKWLILLAVLMAGPVAAQSVKLPPQHVLVVYDQTTGALDEIVIPDSEGEISAIWVPHTQASFPNGATALVPIVQINAVGFAAALKVVAPQAVTPQAQAASASVQAALQANQATP
jgi:hypothetical protein